MTDPSATPMGKDEVLALLGRLATFSAVMKAGEIIAMRDSVAALYAERDALRAENTVLHDAREVLMREVRALKADVDAMQRTNDDLAAENERLANALGRIATEQSAATAQDAADRFQAIARAAIKGDSHPAARTKEHCND